MSAGTSNVVVYRSTDPLALDMIEDMLRVSGLLPQRLGRANPALLGVGAFAIEQLIAVPAEQVEHAQRLIEVSARRPSPETIADLEEQALSARPPAAAGEPPEGLLVDVRAVLAVAVTLIAMWLLLR